MRLLLAAAIVAMNANSAAADVVLLHAAGSLRPALTEVARGFEASTGHAVEAKFGPSGLLKDEIAAGAKAGLFASANMEHPAALHKAGRGGAVVLFARNRLCALVRPGLAVTPDNLLDHLLRAEVKLGTSTPKADPSGDYAWAVFRKAERVKPGAFAALETRALQLTGGPNSPPPPAGRSAYGALVADGKADIFLTYCTNALAAQRENAALQIVALPDALAVGADYGLTVIAGAPAPASALALYIVSVEGQKILARHGFSAPGLAE